MDDLSSTIRVNTMMGRVQRLPYRTQRHRPIVPPEYSKKPMPTTNSNDTIPSSTHYNNSERFGRLVWFSLAFPCDISTPGHIREKRKEGGVFYPTQDKGTEVNQRLFCMPNTIICCWSSNIIIILIAFLAAVSNTTGNTEGTYPNHQPPSLPLLSTITTSAEIMQDSSQSSSSPLSSDILSLKKRLLSNDDETATTTPMMAKKRTKDDSSSVPIPTAASQQPNDNSDNSRACVTPAPSSTSAFFSSTTTTTTTTSNAFHGGKTKNPKTLLNMPSGITKTSKRSDYLSWDEYFLAVAVLSSKRSKDPSSGASGACIVDSENRIVGIGYNGFPRGCSDDIFPWTSSNAEKDKNWLHTKHPYICHAVPNAILNKSSNNVNGCRIYVTIFPTSDCTKMIIQSRIQEVIILESDDVDDGKDEEDEDRQASRILLQMAGVKFRYYKPHVDHVELDFVSSLSPDTTTNDGVSNVLTPNKEGKEDESDNDKEARRLLLEEAGYDPTARGNNINQKRDGYLNWQDYFMSMAFLTAQRSKVRGITSSFLFETTAF